MTIVPGFIDAHCPPDGVRELTGVNVNLRTVADVQAALRKKAAETPPGFWVTNDVGRREEIPTPFYTYVYYHGDKWGEYGDEKMRWMFAHRSLLDHGIAVAGASDYMPGPTSP